MSLPEKSLMNQEKQEKNHLTFFWKKESKTKKTSFSAYLFDSA